MGKCSRSSMASAVALLAGGAGRAPEAQTALERGALRSAGSNSVRSSSKGRPSRKKLVSLMVMASATARSRAEFFADSQVLNQFLQVVIPWLRNSLARRVSNR